ncbi:FkbM family methyltransferase [Botryobacter ruber]|uniref:FkbM family methyltransferase n=1 Tax=Botryobacter ruber TaxID=2171629 RepID=UPI000E0A5A75|nr:FkbM family methyltransferase [Botryobacter ruber]
MLKVVLKKAYKLIPFKKALYRLLKRSFGTPPLRVYQHLYFFGEFEVRFDSTKTFKLQHYGYPIENEIFWKGLYGGWEKESLKLWSRFCRDAQVIVDVGANTGIYSLVAKTVNPAAKVFALEPIQRVYQKLLHNIRINNFDIVAIDKAASNKNGKAIIYDIPAEHQYSATLTLRHHTAQANTVPTEIETVTLASFAAAHQLNNIDLIKIDAERHEAEVLEGFLPLLHSYRTTFLIEIIDSEVAAKIQNYFADKPYLYFNIDETHGYSKVDTIEKSNGFNYLFCTEEKAKAMGLIP